MEPKLRWWVGANLTGKRLAHRPGRGSCVSKGPVAGRRQVWWDRVGGGAGCRFSCRWKEVPVLGASCKPSRNLGFCSK